jgi:hypothetical protein
MTFEQSFVFTGDPERALAAAASTLAAAGLRIDSNTDNALQASNSTFRAPARNPLLAFSVLHLRIADGALWISGELGALERRRKLMQLWIILLVGVELVGYEALFHSGHPLLGFSAGMVLSLTALSFVVIYLQSQTVIQPRAIAAARGLAQKAMAAAA